MTARKGPTPRPETDRYWEKVDISGGPEACWPWTAGVNPRTGYGIFHRAGRKTVNAHRFGAELAGVVSVEDPRVVDHACHNDKGCSPGPCPHRMCQNPAHFDATASAENVNRSHNANARKTHCPQGHAYNPENTRLQVRPTTRVRICLTCQRERGH